MRVVYDYQTFLQQAQGGATRYFFELISGLAAGGGVPLVLCGGLHRSAYPLGAIAGPELRNISWPVPRAWPALLAEPINRLLLCSATSGRSGIYHATGYRRLPVLGRWKRVVTVYDMIHEQLPHLCAAGDRTAQRKRACVLSADVLICISYATRTALLTAYSIPPERTCVIHLGVTRPALPEGPPTRASGQSASRPYLLYVGERSPYKNFQKLLEAWSRLPHLRKDCDLLVFGGGAFTSSERQSMVTLGLASTVRQLQGDDHALWAAYRGAQALVYPSVQEGFGLPPLEAMSVGCPVLCCANECSHEILGEAALNFDNNSPGDLENKLEQLLQDCGLRETLAQRGAVCAAQYSWERCVKETAALYRSL